jgi:hypothetical protein
LVKVLRASTAEIPAPKPIRMQIINKKSWAPGIIGELKISNRIMWIKFLGECVTKIG